MEKKRKGLDCKEIYLISYGGFPNHIQPLISEMVQNSYIIWYADYTSLQTYNMSI